RLTSTSFFFLSDRPPISPLFPYTTLFRSVNLTIEKGEFVSLLGPSGCGKTTTLQMIAGLVEPTLGRISLNGRDITREKPNRRGRSEEHTSELQSRENLVCRLLLEKKKTTT